LIDLWIIILKRMYCHRSMKSSEVNFCGSHNVDAGSIANVCAI